MQNAAIYAAVVFAAEYDRMVEAYSIINKKLQASIVEQSNLEKTIQELKVLHSFFS